MRIAPFAVAVCLAWPASLPAAPPTDGAKAYSSIGKRDPFRSFLRTPRPPADFAVCQWPPLSDYKLVGVVSGGDGPRALFERKDGESSVAELGTLVGKEWAQLVAIEPDSVTFRTEYRDGVTGELYEEFVTKRLAAD